MLTKKAPIIHIVSKRSVDNVDGQSENSDLIKRKMSRGMSTAKKEDSDLISKLKRGEDVERNERQEKALDDLRKGQ